MRTITDPHKRLALLQSTNQRLYFACVMLADKITYSHPDIHPAHSEYTSRLDRRITALLRLRSRLNKPQPTEIIKNYIVYLAQRVLTTNDFTTQRKLARRIHALEHGIMRLRDKFFHSLIPT